MDDLDGVQDICRIESEHPGGEVQLHFTRPFDVLGLAETVALSFERNVRVGYAFGVESGNDLLCLSRRHHPIFKTLQQDHRT